jgi:hypothetical protein
MIEADLVLQINFEDLIKDFTIKIPASIVVKSLIKSSKLIWSNKSASIMNRDKDSSLYCSKVFD